MSGKTPKIHIVDTYLKGRKKKKDVRALCGREVWCEDTTEDEDLKATCKNCLRVWSEDTRRT